MQPAAPPDVHRTRARGLAVIAALVLSAGYALAAAATTPFSREADLLTAIPIAVVAVAAVVLWPARPDPSAVLDAEGLPPPRHPYRGWVVLFAVVVVWEVLEYVWRGSRSAHPTLSSMVDAFHAHSIGKAVAIWAWLWLGAAIVRAGVPVGSRSRASMVRSA